VAQSWTVGTVWSPNDSLSLSVDYLHIAIQDEVMSQDPNLLMEQDAQCLLGQLPSGSPLCEAITNPINGQVQRAGNGLGPITGITTYYANLANETIGSITASGKYHLTLPYVGTLGVQLDYNDMLKDDYQSARGQPPINQLTTPLNGSEFKSIVSGALSWSSLDGRWGSTLYGHRDGSSLNYLTIQDGVAHPEDARVHPWITFNWSMTYTPAANLDLSLLVNNIGNKMPPADPTFTSYPYFNYDSYNVYGREIMLQANLKFGAKPN
jgi:outer membrane receptor protein involved in Fe transport